LKLLCFKKFVCIAILNYISVNFPLKAKKMKKSSYFLLTWFSMFAIINFTLKRGRGKTANDL